MLVFATFSHCFCSSCLRRCHTMCPFWFSLEFSSMVPCQLSWGYLYMCVHHGHDLYDDVSQKLACHCYSNRFMVCCPWTYLSYSSSRFSWRTPQNLIWLRPSYSPRPMSIVDMPFSLSLLTSPTFKQSFQTSTLQSLAVDTMISKWNQEITMTLMSCGYYPQGIMNDIWF